MLERAARERGEVLSLEGLKSCRDVALWGTVLGTVEWVGVGLDDLSSLFQP